MKQHVATMPEFKNTLLVSRLNLRRIAFSVVNALSSSVKISLACCLQKYSISIRLNLKFLAATRSSGAEIVKQATCAHVVLTQDAAPWSHCTQIPQLASACQARPQNSFLSSGQGCVDLPSAAHAAKAGQQVDDLPAALGWAAADVRMARIATGTLFIAEILSPSEMCFFINPSVTALPVEKNWMVLSIADHLNRSCTSHLLLRGTVQSKISNG